MKILKTILKILAIAIIAIIIFVLAILAYVIIKNPYGLGTVTKSYITKSEVKVDLEKYSDYDHPLLTEEQETRIIESGIDIEQIPTEITPEQQQCGIEKLGEARISEIINGAEPSPLEIIKILPCAN